MADPMTFDAPARMRDPRCASSANGVDMPAARPRIVMLVANEFVHDTRVYKEARSLIEWGCDVWVVAIARAGLPARETQDGIEVIRLTARSSDIWRLGVSLAVWWWRAALGRMVPSEVRSASVPAACPPAKKDGAGAAKNGAASCAPPTPKRRSLVSRGYRKTTRPFRTLAKKCRGKARSFGRRLTPSATRVLALNYDFARQARALRPDVVHAHDLNTLLAGRMVQRIDGTRLVYDSHELFLERNIARKSRWRDKLIWAPIERFCIRHVDAAFSVAEGICRHLAKQYRIRKPHLLRNVQPYEPPAPRSRLLADELGIAHERAIVLYPGAITINRGLEAMIDSAPMLDSAVYVVMGYARNAAYMASLKARAEALGVLNKRVYFRDAVPMNDVVRYTASADLGIVPTQNVCLSYYYESSNKIFHCLMAGVPLAMSDHAEKRMIVEEHGVGVLFDETKPESIAAGVNQALADRGAYDVMRENCLNAARVLNWESEERRLRTVYAELLGERAPAVPEFALPQHVQPSIEVEATIAVARHEP